MGLTSSFFRQIGDSGSVVIPRLNETYQRVHELSTLQHSQNMTSSRLGGHKSQLLQNFVASKDISHDRSNGGKEVSQVLFKS